MNIYYCRVTIISLTARESMDTNIYYCRVKTTTFSTFANKDSYRHVALFFDKRTCGNQKQSEMSCVRVADFP